MDIIVDPSGYLTFGELQCVCAVGRNGIGIKDAEGDGISPIGTYALGRVWWRADRLKRPETQLLTFEMTENTGWCDDPDHEDYNRLIALPHPARHERLWRADHAYDVVVEVAFNTDPIEPGKGSAIFIHVAQPDYAPTEGCIALGAEDLLAILRGANETTQLVIGA